MPTDLDRQHLARVVRARDGRQGMILKVLEMVFGPAEKPRRPANPPKITPRAFDVMFGGGTPPQSRKLH